MTITGARMEMAAQSHVGGRDRNEDTVRVDDVGLAVVADGMGGHRAGDVASRIAVETISRSLRHRPRPWHLNGPDICLAISEAHERIAAHAASDSSTADMGTTVVVAYVPPTRDVAWVVHVGDSRAYLFRQHEGLRRLTEDDAVRVRGSGRPLTQAVGRSEIRPTATAVHLRDNDRILLSTDGLHDVVEEREIARILGETLTAEQTCAVLVDAALERGAPDNIGVAIIVLTPQHAPAVGGVTEVDTRPYATSNSDGRSTA